MKRYKLVLEPEPDQHDRHTLRFNGSMGRTFDNKGLLDLQSLINNYVIVKNITHVQSEPVKKRNNTYVKL